MRVTSSATFAIIAASLAATALAMPGGGGGGGSSGSSSPSASAPDFDMAKVYADGVEALKAQRYAEAKAAFKRLLGPLGRDGNINYLAGLADAGLNDLKSAQKFYEKAVRFDRKLVGAQQQLALTYLKNGDRPKAEATLAKLRKQNDDCAGTCEQAASFKDAVASVEAALAGQPTASVETPLLFASAHVGDKAYLDAVGLINERRYEEAIASLQQARATFGPHPDVLTYLGFANRKLNRLGTAETYYRQALAVAPDHRGATEYFGELMVERGDLAGARKMLARLESLCTYGCAEADELRRWIDAGRAPAS